MPYAERPLQLLCCLTYTGSPDVEALHFVLHEPRASRGLRDAEAGQIGGARRCNESLLPQARATSSNEARAKKKCASCTLRSTMLSELQKPRPLLLRLQQACSSQRLSFAAASHRLSVVPGPENAAVGRFKNLCRFPSCMFFFVSVV